MTNREIDQRVLLIAKDAEIERLKEENAHFAWRDADKNKLITELADALSQPELHPNQFGFLMQRAREATHGT